MKFLVTGATGFLGKHLTKRLIDDGHEVIAMNRSGRKPEDTFWKKVQVFSYNSEYDSFIDIESVDVVIHLATYQVYNHHPDDINKLLVSNINFGAHLLEWMREKKIEKIVNISTYFTNTNDSACFPVNFYAATKKMFETLLIYYSQSYEIKAITLELYDVYGPYDTRGKFINLVLQAAKSNTTLKMSKGEQQIAYVHVRDVVDAILLASIMLSNFKETHKIFSIYRQKDIMTLLALIEKIESVLAISVKKDIGHYAYRKNELMTMVPSALLLPGWRSKISLEKGIQEIWETLEK